jgi:cytochrome b involved in lipid metabolism
MNIQNKAVVIVVFIVLFGIGAFFVTKPNSSDQSNTEQIAASSPVIQPTESSTNSDISYTPLKVSEHNKKNDCWTIINGKVYDITSYVPRHPGGDEIVKACGRDGSSLFASRTTEDGDKIGSGTSHSAGAARQLEQYFIGNLE